MSLLNASLLILAGAVTAYALLRARDAEGRARDAEDRADAAEAAACRPVEVQVIRIDTHLLQPRAPRTYTLDELERGL